MKITLNVHLHYSGSGGSGGSSGEVLYLLRAIYAQGEWLMAAAKDIKDLLTQVDTATNDVAARIQKLSDQLTGGVTAAEAEEIKAQLAPLVTRLTAMGKDPNNPVPVPTP